MAVLFFVRLDAPRGYWVLDATLLDGASAYWSWTAHCVS